MSTPREPTSRFPILEKFSYGTLSSVNIHPIRYCRGLMCHQSGHMFKVNTGFLFLNIHLLQLLARNRGKIGNVKHE